jgi:dTDP-4-dehydrorhamnose reductase
VISPETALERPPLVLFGATGQVGRELMQALTPLGSVVAPQRDEADLTKPETLRDVIRAARPAAIVNAAALTNVDQAEREPMLARAVNEIAPGVMAEEGRRIGAVVVHYSTDYVFDGTATTPYDEQARPNPINLYGQTKLAGEQSVAAADTAHLVIRTSWVYSAVGKGFVPTLVRQLRHSEPVRVVADQTGSPTWSRSLARVTAAILQSIAVPGRFELPRDDWGIYHLGGGGAGSRLDIAQEIISALMPLAADPLPVVIPISAAEFNAVAKRPSYTALSNDRVSRRFGLRLDPWRLEVRRMLNTELE